jgi:ATP-dependent Lon protease
MTATASAARDALDDKVNQVFSGKCARKDLVRAIKVDVNVPVFVLEYLLGKYCASSASAAIELGMVVVGETLANNYIRPDEATKAQSKVKENGRYTFIDKMKVHLVGNTYVPEYVNFGSKALRISDDDMDSFEHLLTGGVWAQVEVEWDASDSKAPSSISQLTPIQLASLNLEEYRQLRTQFTSEEWIDLLIRSMGYEPSQFTAAKAPVLAAPNPPLRAQLQPSGAGPSGHRQELCSPGPLPHCFRVAHFRSRRWFSFRCRLTPYIGREIE